VTTLDIISDVTVITSDVAKPRFDVFVAKSFFGVRIRLELEPDRISVVEKLAKNFGRSNIIATAKLGSGQVVLMQ
jgi:hypothetical protein